MFHTISEWLVIENITGYTCLALFGSDDVASMFGLIDPLMNESSPNLRGRSWLPFQKAPIRSMSTLWIVGKSKHRNGWLIDSDTLAPFSSIYVAILWASAGRVRTRFMIILLGNAKFVNFCGRLGVRLNADQSLYGGSSSHSKNILLRVMNVILFGSPDAHRARPSPNRGRWNHRSAALEGF